MKKNVRLLPDDFGEFNEFQLDIVERDALASVFEKCHGQSKACGWHDDESKNNSSVLALSIFGMFFAEMNKWIEISRKRPDDMDDMDIESEIRDSFERSMESALEADADEAWAMARIALVVSELGEAIQGKLSGKNDDHLPCEKNYDVELADAFIRLADMSGEIDGLKMASVIAQKLAYNAKRADHKRENRCLNGGKKA